MMRIFVDLFLIDPMPHIAHHYAQYGLWIRKCALKRANFHSRLSDTDNLSYEVGNPAVADQLPR